MYFCALVTATIRSCAFMSMHKRKALLLLFRVPAGSPSRGGDVAAYVFDINQPSLPTPFYYVLVTVSVFMAL